MLDLFLSLVGYVFLAGAWAAAAFMLGVDVGARRAAKARAQARLAAWRTFLAAQKASVTVASNDAGASEAIQADAEILKAAIAFIDVG